MTAREKMEGKVPTHVEDPFNSRSQVICMNPPLEWLGRVEHEDQRLLVHG